MGSVVQVLFMSSNKSSAGLLVHLPDLGNVRSRRANGVVPWLELYPSHLLPGNPQVEQHVSGMATVQTVVELEGAFAKRGCVCARVPGCPLEELEFSLICLL